MPGQLGNQAMQLWGQSLMTGRTFAFFLFSLSFLSALTQVKKKMEEKTTESKQTGLQAGTWKVCIGKADPVV